MSEDEQPWFAHRTASGPANRPNSVPRICSRTQLKTEVSLRRSGHHNFRVKIFDASASGCKVEYIERPELDEKLFVKFDGLEPLGAYVCWIGEREVGLEFDRPIHPAVFDLLMQRARSQSASKGPLRGAKLDR